jgi:hypothetical protein
VAKRTNEQIPQRANSTLRMRWVEVELNGSDTTIEEALRAVERIRQPVIDVAPTLNRLGHNGSHARGGDAPPVHAAMFDQEVPDQSAGEPAAEVGVDTAPGLVSPRLKRGGGDRKDRNAGVKPLGDIDFVPSGKQSLKDFFAEKAPRSDMDQILVLCHFLQHTAQSSQIGPGHVLSGFKHVGKRVLKDLK